MLVSLRYKLIVLDLLISDLHFEHFDATMSRELKTPSNHS